MPFDRRNANLLWSSILVETCHRAGARVAVVCPGSRSGPLAIAFASSHARGEIETISVLDERSAAFLALGMAKKSGRPVIVVCSSGTAGANFLPAAIEAQHARVPLLLLSADRPPELRDCHAGQAIDQAKLFGSAVNGYAELALPEARLEMLQYLRQSVLQAIAKTQLPVPGPVHLNVPFREPLAPLPEDLPPLALDEGFWAGVAPPVLPRQHAVIPWQTWQACPRGVIVAGPAAPTDPNTYCRAVARLAACLGWPVLADGLSPLRNWADFNPHLIATYDLALRDLKLADTLACDLVLQIGPLPTSKALRACLARWQPQRWTVAPAADNFDPLHGHTQHLTTTAIDLATSLLPAPIARPSDYLRTWLQLEAKLQRAIDATFAASTFAPSPLEAKIARVLGRSLPPRTPLIVANSMPVRDIESFWPPNVRRIPVYCNRGANGIDGTLSTALGVAWGSRAVLVTGDLALLHDTNGFLVARQLRGHLTIVLIDNNGGGIFNQLPIAAYDPPFEALFATPQNIDFAHLTQTYGIPTTCVASWEHLAACLQKLPTTGMRLLKLACDRQADARWRQEILPKLAAT